MLTIKVFCQDFEITLWTRVLKLVRIRCGMLKLCLLVAVNSGVLNDYQGYHLEFDCSWKLFHSTVCMDN